MGSAYVKSMSWRRVLEAYALGAVLILLVKPTALLGAPAACVLALGFNSYFNRKIGGLTGDTLGAANELCALAMYALAALRFVA